MKIRFRWASGFTESHDVDLVSGKTGIGAFPPVWDVPVYVKPRPTFTMTDDPPISCFRAARFVLVQLHDGSLEYQEHAPQERCPVCSGRHKGECQ